MKENHLKPPLIWAFYFTCHVNARNGPGPAYFMKMFQGNYRCFRIQVRVAQITVGWVGRGKGGKGINDEKLPLNGRET